MIKVSYILSYWKLGVHHLFKTRRFGVDNKWWSPFDSKWGLSLVPFILQFVLLYPFFYNYRAMKIRLGPSVAFIPKSEYQILYSSSLGKPHV